VLASRSVAVRTDVETDWTRTQVSGADVPIFARLAALPITSWSYRITSIVPSRDSNLVAVTAVVAYRLDADAVDDLVDERITLRHDRVGWRVVSEHTHGARMLPWDLGDLTVIHGRRALVIGIDIGAATLREYATLADRVADDVTAFWGSDWVHSPVVIVPGSTSQMAGGLARTTGSLAGLGAVTVDMNISGPNSRGSERVWTNTPALTGLSAVGREILLRHELLHEATGSASTAATPLWLEEGLAEYIGYLGSGVSFLVSVGDAVADVRAGHLPTVLPTDSAFSGSRLAIVYESSHVAVDLLVRDYGQAAVIRFYRLVAAGTGTSSANVESALYAVTGQGVAAFTSAWRTRLQSL